MKAQFSTDIKYSKKCILFLTPVYIIEKNKNMNQKEEKEEALITHHVLKRHIKNGRHLSTIIHGVVTTIDVFLVEGLGSMRYFWGAKSINVTIFHGGVLTT